MKKVMFSFLTAVLIVFSLANVSADITNGLTAYYKFDGNAQDSADSNHGTNNGVTFTGGKFGQAGSFDGINGYINIPSFAQNFNSFSVATWVNVNEYKNKGKIIDFGNTKRFTLQVDREGFEFNVNNGVLVQENTIYQTNKTGWVHLVAVWTNGGNSNLYINGVLKKSNPTAFNSTISILSGDTKVIGRRITNTDFFNGLIDEVRIYNRALSASDVSELYSYNGEIPPSSNVSGGGNISSGGGGGGSSPIPQTKIDKCSALSSEIIKNIYEFKDAAKLGEKKISLEGFSSWEDISLDGRIYKVVLISAKSNEATLIVYVGDTSSVRIIPVGSTRSVNTLMITVEASGKNDAGKIWADLTISEDSVAQEEGQRVFQGQYLVVPFPDGGSLFEITQITNSSSSTPSDDEINIRNVLSGLSYRYRAITEGKGTMTIGGVTINYDYYGSSEQSNGKTMSIKATWTSPSETHTFYCPAPPVPNPEVKSCTDSDGGIDLFVKGEIIGCTTGEQTGGCGGASDVCQNDQFLTEYYCNTLDATIESNTYECENGCLEGVCLDPEEAVLCGDYISEIQNAEDINESGLELEFYHKYSWNSSTWTENSEKKSTEYSALWSGWKDGTSYLLEKSVNVFENKEFDAKTIIDKQLQYSSICKQKTIWANNNEAYRVYICQTFNYRNGLDNQERDSKYIFWAKDNVLSKIYYSINKQLTQEEIEEINKEKTEDAISKIVDNRAEEVPESAFDLDPLMQAQVEKSLTQCPSDLTHMSTPETPICEPYWSCKIEPVICPPHGYQTRICSDMSSCGEKSLETQLYCNPGICSGCYTSRWYKYEDFDHSKGLDNICIPYGTRLEGQKEYEEEKLYEGIIGDDDLSFEIKIISDSEVTLQVNNSQNNYARTYILTLNKETVVYIPYDKGEEKFTLKVTKIVEAEGDNKGYFEFIVIQDRGDQFCDIDGQFKLQKVKDSQGNWAKCQNNYECDSNFCSGGECVEINDAIKKASGIKSLFVRVLCRFAHLFSEQNYNACIGENLGLSPAIDAWQP